MEAIKFEDLNLDAKILRAVTDMGFEAASPIQGQSIPLELEGLDIIGQAQTGTGKTAAFGIPLLQKVDPKSKSYRRLSCALQENWQSRYPRKSGALQNICTELRFFRFTEDRKSEGPDTFPQGRDSGYHRNAGTCYGSYAQEDAEAGACTHSSSRRGG